MQDHPLGLPKGSIRGILVIIIVAGAVAGTMIAKPDISNKFFDLLKMLIPLYFGSRLDWNKEKKEEVIE